MEDFGLLRPVSLMPTLGHPGAPWEHPSIPGCPEHRGVLLDGTGPSKVLHSPWVRGSVGKGLASQGRDFHYHEPSALHCLSAERGHSLPSHDQ